MTASMAVSGAVVRRMIALLLFAACSPADGDGDADGPTPGQAAATAEAIATADANQDITSEDSAEDSASGPANAESTPTPACVPPPEGLLAADASLEGRTGDYRLTMVEEVDDTVARAVVGGLVLRTQVESLRQFEGSAGDPIPGVTSPLYGSTDINVEGVGAVRVGDLASEDPTSPGVLVIESETGASPSILLRFGSDANRRDLVRFDGGYAVLNVAHITTESFSGTWSSGAGGPDSEGFFCATQIR